MPRGAESVRDRRDELFHLRSGARYATFVPGEKRQSGNIISEKRLQPEW